MWGLLVQQNTAFLQRYKTQQTKLVVLFSKPKQQTARWLAFINHPEEGFCFKPSRGKWMRLQRRINKKGQMPGAKINTSKKLQTAQNLSFHLLQEEQDLSLRLLGNKPVATSGASHPHSILPSPLFSQSLHINVCTAFSLRCHLASASHAGATLENWTEIWMSGSKGRLWRNDRPCFSTQPFTALRSSHLPVPHLTSVSFIFFCPELISALAPAAGHL